MRHDNYEYYMRASKMAGQDDDGGALLLIFLSFAGVFGSAAVLIESDLLWLKIVALAITIPVLGMFTYVVHGVNFYQKEHELHGSSFYVFLEYMELPAAVRLGIGNIVPVLKDIDNRIKHGTPAIRYAAEDERRQLREAIRDLTLAEETKQLQLRSAGLEIESHAARLMTERIREETQITEMVTREIAP